jgi:hypothetical protein
MIEGENELVYDDMTTSYQLNLPSEYYMKMIQQQLPSKEHKWFIRPHHVESITNHHNSIKDELLNTRYFKHHNNQYGKVEEPNEKQDCIDYIQKHVQQLKLQQTVMAVQRGIDIDNLDRYKSQVAKEANNNFEKAIKEKPKGNGRELCIKAYEAILNERRKKELDQLNKVRFKEIEKNRPPEDYWYEKNDTEFSKELYRNRVALKPNNSNRVYLNTLKDPFLY